MMKKIKNWFNKYEDKIEFQPQQPKNNETNKFVLMLDNIRVGTLVLNNGEWIYKYDDEFKNHADNYNLIIGFSDLNKVYKSETLWPFFQIRIPGLKQPAIQKIIKEEQIDVKNEVDLLKRFGKKTISNPYQLI